MRKIKVKSWKENGEDQDIISLINIVLRIPDAPNSPGLAGIDNFRTYSRLDGAFKKAEKTNELELQESDWVYIKDQLDKKVPASWGLMADVAEAIESFMGAEKVEDKKDDKKE